MTSLAVTIGGQAFDHLAYHFVLTYSNWESITICFSESFENLSEGLQNAVWELGGVPERHRTDRMSLAVNNASQREGVYGSVTRVCWATTRWRWRRSSLREANENGDVEQIASAGSRKEWIKHLMLRGHRRLRESRVATRRF